MIISYLNKLKCYLGVLGYRVHFVATKKLCRKFSYADEFLSNREAKDGFHTDFTREKLIRPIKIANDVFSRERKMIRPIRSHKGA